MPSSLEVILVPTFMILVGLMLKRLSILDSSDSTLLTRIVLNISLPALIFVNLSKADISGDMLILPVIGLLLSFILLSAAYFYCRLRNYSKKTTWTIMIASSMMNTGFIGFPVSLGVFGNEGFLHAIFYDLSTTILFIVYGMILVKEFGGDRNDILRQSLKFIPLWAVVFAVIFNVFNLPIFDLAGSILGYFADSTIPLIMLSLGLTIDFNAIGRSIGDSLFVSFVKLVLSPCIICMILSLLHITGMTFNVAILEAGMSTAMNALVLAITYDLDVKLMSSLIFTNVILSLFTLTAIISFLL
ncbi:MAG: AEC family transporter [Methanosphaera sp.]|nr:AEC family transporter [Methanosphaera sp.]